MNTLRLLSLLSALAAVAVPSTALATQPAAVNVVPQTDAQAALDALQLLLSAYATGDQKQIEALVDPTMIGYSRVVDPVRDAAVAQKQMRLSLSDTRTQISEDVVIIRTHWEKRFTSGPGRQAGYKSGVCTFVLRPDAAVWRLSALSGNNPFGAE
jgi:hypothetical protein